MKKTIYSLIPLQTIFALSNHRYLEFISTIADNSVALYKLNKISKNVLVNTRSYRGFNFFHKEDHDVLLAVSSGEFTIRGFRNKDLRMRLQRKSTNQICRILKRLRLHGLIRKIPHSFKYYLTLLGRQVITMGLSPLYMVCFRI